MSPAVVTITNSTRPSAFDPFSIPTTAVGSGCIVASDGRILTPIEAAKALVDQASA